MPPSPCFFGRSGAAVQSTRSPTSLKLPDPNTLPPARQCHMEGALVGCCATPTTNSPASSLHLAELLACRAGRVLPGFWSPFPQGLSRYKLNLSSWDFPALFLTSLTTAKQQAGGQETGQEICLPISTLGGSSVTSHHHQVSSARGEHKAHRCG